MSEIQQVLYDLGTPAPRDSANQVSLQIDGHQIQVAEGTSVMRAAAMLGINIPKLCATDSLDAFGSCRMCLVEIDGHRGSRRIQKHFTLQFIRRTSDPMNFCA